MEGRGNGLLDFHASTKALSNLQVRSPVDLKIDGQISIFWSSEGGG